MYKWTSALFIILMLGVTATIARAWPDQVPTKATISGPGIEGEVQITDVETLKALKLGTSEDFSRGAILAPKVTDGYKIRRWFDDGTFEFGHLTYYPMPNDANGNELIGYVYFQDGRPMEGNTPYNQKWFHATKVGDAALKKLLIRLGVTLPGNAGSTIPVMHNPEPVAPVTTSSAQTNSDPFANARLGVEIVVALGAGIGVWILLRRHATA